jgi:hypothetical protein
MRVLSQSTIFENFRSACMVSPLLEKNKPAGDETHWNEAGWFLFFEL